MIKKLKNIQKDETATLAKYAMLSQNTKGRLHKEQKNNTYRSPYQRDKDRIIHSRSFRRLQGKTQVFIATYGDHYRDRLTHTIEVAQIARGISRTLGLNEDLSEAIALAHDLGHTPFGHGGEHALNQIMQQYNSNFEHNEQSTRIVKELERIYPDFNGLNLSIEVLDGLLKHDPHNQTPYTNFEKSPHLEAQVTDISDEIAYINHDMEDGLRAGILKEKELEKFTLWQKAKQDAIKIYGKELLNKDKETKRRLLSRINSRMINIMIKDVIKTTEKMIQNNEINSLEKVRKFKKRLVKFSKKNGEEIKELKKYLLNTFYLSKKVMSQIEEGKKIIYELFNYYMTNIDVLPDAYIEQINKGTKKHIIIKDYIAGMTDKFAQEEYKKII